MRGLGSQLEASFLIRSQVVRSRWLRRRSERLQSSVTLSRNVLSARELVGTAWSLKKPLGIDPVSILLANG